MEKKVYMTKFPTGNEIPNSSLQKRSEEKKTENNNNIDLFSFSAQHDVIRFGYHKNHRECQMFGLTRL